MNTAIDEKKFLGLLENFKNLETANAGKTRKDRSEIHDMEYNYFMIISWLGENGFSFSQLPQKHIKTLMKTRSLLEIAYSDSDAFQRYKKVSVQKGINELMIVYKFLVPKYGNF